MEKENIGQNNKEDKMGERKLGENTDGKIITEQLQQQQNAQKMKNGRH